MGNDALLNVESFDDVCPRLVIQMKNSLVFRDVLVLDLSGCTCNSRILKHCISLEEEGREGHSILTEGG